MTLTRKKKRKIGSNPDQQEGLRVLLNLIDVSLTVAAVFLSNQEQEEAQRLLKCVNNPELQSIYDFLVT